jgi:hypothetical protein
MKKKITLILNCLLFTCCLFGQDDEDKKKSFKNELGLNVTSLLADLLGNNNRTDAGEYLLTYKRVSGNKAFRLGLTANFSINKENSFRFNNTLTNQNFQLRLGKEWRQNLSANFQYYFGGDALLGLKTEESNATITGGTITQKDKITSLGIGPVLGFQFALLDRLLIGTEGAIYASYRNSSVNFVNIISSSSIGIPSRESSGINVQTNLPKFLFLIVKF